MSAEPPTVHSEDRAPHWSLIAASVALALTLLNVAMMNVALPTIGERLGGGTAGLQWVANGYAIAFASLLLPAGALADGLGARKVLLLGTTIFAAGSALTALAPELVLVVAGQVVAGTGAAIITPSAIGLIREAYPNSAARTRAVALVSIGMALGFGTGPVIGGILIEAAGWRWMFAVNLLASAVVVALIRMHVPASIPQAVRVPDLLGVAAGVVTLAALTFALIEGGNVGWGEPVVIVAAVVAVAAGVLFVRLQRTGAEPLLPRRLFAQREVSIVAVLGLLFNFTAYSQMFVLALWFQREWGFTPLQNALMFLPAAFATLVTALFVGRLAARVGPRPLLAIGLGGNALAPVIMMFTGGDAGDTGVVIALRALFVAGIAGGLVVPGLNIVIAVSSPPDLIGVGTAVLNAQRQIGGVLGIAILGSLIGDGTDVGAVHVALAVGATASALGLLIAWISVRAGPATEGEVLEAHRPELEAA
jgi:DHA2 family methylenomycin A resistance protein-like MFS transporter